MLYLSRVGVQLSRKFGVLSAIHNEKKTSGFAAHPFVVSKGRAWFV